MRLQNVRFCRPVSPFFLKIFDVERNLAATGLQLKIKVEEALFLTIVISTLIIFSGYIFFDESNVPN